MAIVVVSQCCPTTSIVRPQVSERTPGVPGTVSARYLRRNVLSSWASSFGSTKSIGPASAFPRVRLQRCTAKRGIVRSHTETTEVPETTSRVACPTVKPEIDHSTVEAVDIRVGIITDAKAVTDAEMSVNRGKPTLSRTHLQLTRGKGDCKCPLCGQPEDNIHFLIHCPGYSHQSDTLFKSIKVDIGCEVRTVVSECKYVMDVEDAVGKKVLFIANVPPTEVLGIPSHGIVLTGLNYDPTPMPRSFKVILPGLGRLPPGSQVRGACTPR